MTRQIVRKPTASLKPGSNVRSDLGDEADLRRLGQSLKKGQQTPLLITPLDVILDGYRRHKAAVLEGIAELDCLVVEGNPTPAELKSFQLVSAVHRADLSPYDKAVAVRDIKAATPQTGKELAETLDMDQSSLSRLLALFDCVPEVQEAAREGKIGLTDWYAIARSPDQLCTLALKLGGASRAELEKAAKKPKATEPAVKTAKLDCPLVGGARVTVKAAPGEEVSLEEYADALKEALKLVNAAISKQLTAKSAQLVWRDVAAAG